MPIKKTAKDKFSLSIRQCFLSLIILLISSLAPAAEKANTQAHYPPFAVVELFTSEGCSSCPPADQLLTQLTENSQTKYLNLYTLSFHVDYWNQLGWVDPFSSTKFTKRQKSYAKVNKAENVYTPQMIVNGSLAFKGFRYDLAEKVLEDVLTQPGSAQLELSVDTVDAKKIKISYKVSAEALGQVLFLALVERNLHSAVNKGENYGKTLRHSNVVRTFKTVSLRRAAGETTLMLPDSLQKKEASIIGFIQHPKTMKILGAHGVDLPT